MYRFSKIVTNCDKGGQLHSCAVLHIDHNEKGSRQYSSMIHFFESSFRKKMSLYTQVISKHTVTKASATCSFPPLSVSICKFYT
jgi:hypothetical protein